MGLPLSIAPAVDRTPWSQARVQREVARARVAQTVIHPGPDGLCVFWTTADQSPCLLRQIGRERELTFRAVGEGTGRPVDLDAFDHHYLHLCAWNVRRRELVGAYRLRSIGTSRSAMTAISGVPDPGLYTQTLFGFDQKLLGRLAPAMELGRAFIRTPYQKEYAPLMLLWRGIGRMAARFPGVRHLFGAASIASTHSPAARALMLAYLRRYAFDDELAPLVSARRPPSESLEAQVEAARFLPRQPHLHALNAGVMALNPGGAPVPVLLRQYLKLEARVLGFSVDSLFQDAIDALVVVDLHRVPPALQHRYLTTDLATSSFGRQPQLRTA